ncbi:MAG TPA: hypothetical protein VGC34_19230 [Steroidobacteraceae bacterium]
MFDSVVASTRLEGSIGFNLNEKGVLTDVIDVRPPPSRALVPG